MRKILPIALALILVSCSPFQRLVVLPSHLTALLEDSCDIEIMARLKQFADTAGTESLFHTHELPEGILPDSCTFMNTELYFPPGQDSSIWLLTIRPAYMGNKELIIGNLYTLSTVRDTLVFVRRIKEYSQTEEFESGKYLGFTYFFRKDSTEIIKVGTKMF